MRLRVLVSFRGVLRQRSGMRVLRVLALVTAATLVATLLQVIAPPEFVPRAVAATSPAAGEYVPLTQTRIVDSRIGQGLSGPVVAGTDSSFQVTGQGGVPAVSQVAAVVLTVTAVTPSVNSWTTFWAQGTTAPAATSLILNAGQTVANSLITKVGSTGLVSVKMGSGSMHLLVEVQGYYTSSSATTAAATFVPLTLARVYDSRSGGSALGAGATRTVPVLGKGGVPSSGVAAVVLNVTSTGSTASTYLEVWPGGTRPNPGSTLECTRRVEHRGDGAGRCRGGWFGECLRLCRVDPCDRGRGGLLPAQYR